MKKRQQLYFEEWPEDGLPYMWRPDRVPHCRQAACRRARRCVRPRMLEGRPPPRFPSCPLITDKEWAAWGMTVLRFVEDLVPEAEARLMADRQGNFADPARMVFTVHRSWR